MSRFPLGVLAALLFLAGLLYWLLIPSTNKEPNAIIEGPNRLEQEQSAKGAASVDTTSMPALAREPQKRLPTKAPVTYSDTPETSLLVTVLDHETKQPLVGADLLYFASHFDSDIYVESGPGMPTIETILSEHGLRYLTDQHGQARIPSDGGGFYLGLTTNEYFNYGLYFEQDDFDLYARPPLLIPCQVLDHEEQPVSNIPVYLGIGYDMDAWWMQERRTTEQGIANLLIYDRFRMDVEERDGQEARFFVKVDALTLTPQVQDFPVAQPPSAPFVFHLNPFGSLTVNLLSGTGDPLTKSYSIQVYSVTEREMAEPKHWSMGKQHLQNRLITETHSGQAVFPRIGFGQSLLVVVADKDEEYLVSGGVEGPRKKDEAVSINLYPEGMAPIYLGRILNEEGAVGKNIRFSYIVRNPESPNRRLGSGSFQTDHEGRFVLEPKAKLAPGQTAHLTITMRATKNKPIRGVVMNISELQETGPHDLGDLILGQPPMLAKGIVLNPSGHAVAGASVNWAVAVPNPYRPTDINWREDWSYRVDSGEDGTFELHGFPDGERIKITAEKDGLLPAEMEIQVPENFATLQLLPAWYITGKLIPNEHMQDDSLSVEFECNDLSMKNRWVWSRMSNDGSFRSMDSLAPGIWELRIRDLPLFQRTIELGPEGGNYDLGTIDLQGLYQPMRILVERADGSKPYWIQARNKDSRAIGDEEEDGVLLILTSTPLEEIYISAQDTQVQKVRNPHDGMKVVLQTGYPINIEISDPPELAPGWTISVNVVSRESKQLWFADLIFLGPPWFGEGVVPFPGNFEAAISLNNLAVTGASAGGIMAAIPIGNESDMVPFQVVDTNAPQTITLSIDSKLLAEAVALMHANQH